jgi:UDP-2,3-diacylglucosamine hydrolase
MTQPPLDALGMIAGNRSLPLLLARQAREMGVKKLVAVGFHGETDPQLAALVDELVWLKVGQLSKLIQAFKSRQIRRCVMAGQIAPKNLFDIRPDLRGIFLLFRLKEKNAHTIFGAIGDELKKEGIDLIPALPWLEPLMPRAPFHLGPALTPDQEADAIFGFRMAKEISRLDIGQTVVVKNGTVLAVEGFEGTDECLRRGGPLAGQEGGAVAVKAAKNNHDMRFDIPCIGPATLETCAAARIAVLAFEGGGSLVLEQEKTAQLARNHRICLTTIS